LIPVARGGTVAALALAAAVTLGGCGSAAPSTPSPAPPQTGSPAPPALESPSGTQPAASAIASPSLGFSFAAQDIAAYYEGQGYVCGAPEASPKAGFTVRSCNVIDDAGRTRVIGLVTDASGALVSGSASVTGTASEAVLAPIDALDPLAGLLGATLGEQRGSALLTWLASHLGDANAETASGPLRVRTHTANETDHRTLSVEVSTQAYLNASP